MIFERHLEDNLFTLYEELKNNSYFHSLYQYFPVYDTKKRNIYKSDVKDRIVHEIIRKDLEVIYKNVFIADTYASLTKRGVSAALNRTVFFSKSVSDSNFGRCLILKCDIKKYFNNINHEILLDLLKLKIKDQRELEVIKKIILSFGEDGKGIPLGNSVSQMFANVYLNELDYFVKNILRVRFYIRYNDDFIIMDSNRAILEKYKKLIINFVQKRLALEIPEEKTSITNLRNGFEFLGYKILPDCVLFRKKTKKLLFERIHEHNMSSYLGLLSNTSSYFLRQKVLGLVRKQSYRRPINLD